MANETNDASVGDQGATSSELAVSRTSVSAGDLEKPPAEVRPGEKTGSPEQVPDELRERMGALRAALSGEDNEVVRAEAQALLDSLSDNPENPSPSEGAFEEGEVGSNSISISSKGANRSDVGVRLVQSAKMDPDLPDDKFTASRIIEYTFNGADYSGSSQIQYWRTWLRGGGSQRFEKIGESVAPLGTKELAAGVTAMLSLVPSRDESEGNTSFVSMALPGEQVIVK